MNSDFRADRLLRKKGVRPKLNEFIHASEYFSALFEYRRRQDEGFSYEEWAAELGFKSRSFLRMICQGKRRVTPQFIKIYSEKNRMTEAEIEYLTGMSLYENAKSAAQRKIFLDKLLEKYIPSSVEVDIDYHKSFLSNKNYPLIQALLSFQDLDNVEEDLQKILNISKEQLQLCLKELERIGIIEKHEKWTAKSHAFKVPDSKANPTLKKFHAESLKEAQEILDDDGRQRRFRSIYFPMKSEQFEDMSEEIEAFLNKLKAKFGSREFADKKMFKLNLNAFAVTEAYKKEPET